MNELGFTKGSKFRIACREGNLAEARHFLADPSFDPNQVSDRSGLMVAAEKARLDIVLLLLGDARVDVNVTNDNGENAFMLACQEGHSPVVELLLKDGRTNFDKRNYLGRTGFWLACWYNRTSTIELLLSHGELVNPTIPSLRGKPPSQAGNAATRKLVEDAVNRMLKFGTGVPHEDSRLPQMMRQLTLEREPDHTPGHAPLRMPLSPPLSPPPFSPPPPRTAASVADRAASLPPMQNSPVAASPSPGINGFNVPPRNLSSKSASTSSLGEGSSPRSPYTPVSIATERTLSGESQKTSRFRRLAEANTATTSSTAAVSTPIVTAAESRKSKWAKIAEDNVSKRMSASTGSDGNSVPDVSGRSFGSDEDEKLPERMTPAAVISKLRVSASDIDYDKTKKPLGEGGFGVVYSGTFKKYNRVAIKVLKDANPKAMKDFAAEIAVWDGLVQKNILPLMAFCEDPPMMVSELAVDGNMRESLTKLKWSLSTGLKYLVHVTHGMTFLHSNNIVHLDLKPPNVLIDNGIAKITDFGMSKVRQRVTTVAGNGYGGTHGYMAPEVYEGIMGRGADVYAFAMMLYEVVSQGKIPFRGGSALQVMNAVVNGVRPPRPNSVAVDERHWQLIEDCWHQERSKRPMFFEIRERMEPWLKEDPKTAVYSAQWSDR